MFGPFKLSTPLSGGLLWKIPWRLSKFQKNRQRLRLRRIDSIVATVDSALKKQGVTTKAVELWKQEMPTEPEMLAKDKYTIFDRKVRKYRKGIHSQTTEMDESEPKAESSRLLKVYGMIHRQERWAVLFDMGCIL
ncbi:ribosomal protein subunit L31 [Venturia nashicola]|nr:ribosomal protein subunit L31 [Venturia nashicola]